MEGLVAIAVAVENARLRRVVERVARQLGAETLALDGEGAVAPQVVAVVCALPSDEWDSRVARVLRGGPVVPHILLVTEPGPVPWLRLLSAPSRVRKAVAGAVNISASIESDLRDLLAPWVKSSVTAVRLARIQDLVAGDDPDLWSIAATILREPTRHTTLGGAIRDAGTPRARALRSIGEAGFAPPTQFLRTVRTLGAHALLRDGATVERCARALGYGKSDTLRVHFDSVFGMAPSAARELPLTDLAHHLRRTRERTAG